MIFSLFVGGCLLGYFKLEGVENACVKLVFTCDPGGHDSDCGHALSVCSLWSDFWTCRITLHKCFLTSCFGAFYIWTDPLTSILTWIASSSFPCSRYGSRDYSFSHAS